MQDMNIHQLRVELEDTRQQLGAAQREAKQYRRLYIELLEQMKKRGIVIEPEIDDSEGDWLDKLKL